MKTNFYMNGKASVVIDGQFGSTGKGLIVGWIDKYFGPPDIACTNASANAGHTLLLEGGQEIVTYHLPMMTALHPETQQTIINAGAIIDPEVLWGEIKKYNVNINNMHIHPRAAIITSQDRASEREDSAGTTRVASTQKGVGAALARKIRREAALAESCFELRMMVRHGKMTSRLRHGQTALIEVPQGASLSINSSPFYPQCTSREISVSQALSDAGLHPHDLGNVLLTLRTFPIRVGHIFDTTGQRIGHSGPGYDDQWELTWDRIGVKPELTTVTRRPRRIFTWSRAQVEDAIRINRPDFVFLNFVNYLKEPEELEARIGDIEAASDKPVQIIYGLGPKVSDIYTEKLVVYERMGWLNA